MQIAGLQKSSLLDYPSKIAAVVFTFGCNFRCSYCHNPNLIGPKKFRDTQQSCVNEIFERLIEKVSRCRLRSAGDTCDTGLITAISSDVLFDETAVFDFLKTRTGKLDAVVVSGGEPTLQKDLVSFFEKLKAMGFLTKLDTNGTNTDTVKVLVEQGLVDYIAMDIKSPLEKYSQITCRKIDTQKIHQSIKYIMSCGVDYEFRTTVVRSQLDEEDFESIGKLLKGAKKYYLQKFVNTHTLNPDFINETTYTDEEFMKIKEILNKYIDTVFVR